MNLGWGWKIDMDIELPNFAASPSPAQAQLPLTIFLLILLIVYLFIYFFPLLFFLRSKIIPSTIPVRIYFVFYAHVSLNRARTIPTIPF